MVFVKHRESPVLTGRHLLPLPEPWWRVGSHWCWPLLSVGACAGKAGSASVSLCLLLFFEGENHPRHTPKTLSSSFTQPVGNVSMVSVNTIPVHLNLHIAFDVSPIINYVLQGAITIAEILEPRRVTLPEVPKRLIKIKS